MVVRRNSTPVLCARLYKVCAVYYTKAKNIPADIFKVKARIPQLYAIHLPEALPPQLLRNAQRGGGLTVRCFFAKGPSIAVSDRGNPSIPAMDEVRKRTREW